MLREVAILAFTMLQSSVAVGSGSECFDRTGKNYSLAWASEGRSFFDGWDFGEQDFTGGAVRYVNRSEAKLENLTQAHDNYAIVQPGSVENRTRLQRKSVRLSTHESWTYFVAAMRFSHTPFGCGVWPAFWTNGAAGNWPTDGELDILEYWNGAKSEVSFHTANDDVNGCKLDSAQLKKKGCPQFDDVNNDFTPWFANDCRTDYNSLPAHMGCAPTSSEHDRYTGEQYANNPGVMAAEWTKDFIKVFYIPEAEIPEDLAEGVAPKPDEWDKWIISYYPFGDSERANPGSCNLTSQSLASAQSFVLNIELCGDRGSIEFPFGCGGVDLCRNKRYAAPGDCCYDYMTNPEKSDKAIATDAFFNISWIKVWQQGDATL